MADKRVSWVVVDLATGYYSKERYASVASVIRYGLAKERYGSGQYDIYAADEYGNRVGSPHRAYKRV